MKKLAILAAVVVLMGLPGWASANSVSYTTSTPVANTTLTDWGLDPAGPPGPSGPAVTLAFQKFNLAGTLTQIELSLSSGMDTTLTVTNLGGSTSSGSVHTELQLNVKDPLSLITDQPQIDINTASQAYSLAINETKILSKKTGSGIYDNFFSDAGLLAEFTGSGNILLDAFSLTQTWQNNTGGNTSTAQLTHGGLTGTITYEYTPVPTPPTVLLLGSGLVGLLALRWRRKGPKS
jgi:hypothetical protein